MQHLSEKDSWSSNMTPGFIAALVGLRDEEAILMLVLSYLFIYLRMKIILIIHLAKQTTVPVALMSCCGTLFGFWYLINSKFDKDNTQLLLQ